MPGEVCSGKSATNTNDNVLGPGVPLTPAGGPAPPEGPVLPQPPGIEPPALEVLPPTEPLVIPAAAPSTLPKHQPAPPAADGAKLPAGPPAGKGTWTDPQVRTTPTITGAIMNLAPYEVPADRLVEMSRKLEAQAAEMANLTARIRELEALAVSREQSVAESHREAEAQSAEARRLRADVAALQVRIEQIEREDVEILRAVIAALERLLGPPTPRREP
jgi:hypothetical protein